MEGPSRRASGAEVSVRRPSVQLPPLTPIVKWLLIILTTIHFTTEFIDLGSPETLDVIILWFGLNAATWFEAPLFVPLWQLATCTVLHADLGHLASNLLVLYFFGTKLESIVGSRRFLWFYVAAGLVSSMLSLAIGLMIPGLPSIGASGAVMGVVAAAAVFQPMTPVLLLFIPVPLWALAVGFAAFDLFPALAYLGGAASDGIDRFAHLGGGLLGVLAVKTGLIWRDWGKEVEQKVEARKAQALENDEQKLDELLSRVAKEGIQSLSGREREFLKRMSDRKRGG